MRYKMGLLKLSLRKKQSFLNRQEVTRYFLGLLFSILTCLFICPLFGIDNKIWHADPLLVIATYDIKELTCISPSIPYLNFINHGATDALGVCYTPPDLGYTYVIISLPCNARPSKVKLASVYWSRFQNVHPNTPL